MSDQLISELAEQVINVARDRNLKLTSAESCTGGLIGGALTRVPGSSDVYEGGVVTYSYESKRDLLGVSWDVLNEKGAVSPEIAEQMANGVLSLMQGRANVSVSVTGIAGPGGGTSEKPVGLVYFGISQATGVDTIDTFYEKQIFDENNRDMVRNKTVERALRLYLQAME